MDTFFRLAVNNQRLAGYNLNVEQRINFLMRLKED